MLEAGLLVPVWGSWQVDETALDELDLPTDVVDLVVRRVETLVDEVRSILRTAAVIGSSFEPSVLAAATGAEAVHVHDATAAGFAARILEREEGGGRHRFVHAEVRRALTSGMTPEELQGDIGVQILLGNTYHLYIRPGLDVVERHGGRHQMMHWDGPILTNSGGFQVFSLKDLRKIE